MPYIGVAMWDGVVSEIEVFEALPLAEEWFLDQLKTVGDFAHLRDSDTGTLKMSVITEAIEDTHMSGSNVHWRDMKTGKTRDKAIRDAINDGVGKVWETVKAVLQEHFPDTMDGNEDVGMHFTLEHTVQAYLEDWIESNLPGEGEPWPF